MRPAPELPPERRLALVVAISEYEDPQLRALRAPVRDAADLAEILADAQLGGFEVTQVVDASAREMMIALETFLQGTSVNDLVLVYLSCHGLLDESNRLYFAARDTVKKNLAATAMESARIKQLLDDCRVWRQLVILDCCYSGRFVEGKSGGEPGLREVEITKLQTQGRGRVVLTASRSTEYSFEGEQVAGAQPAGSVFTTALVEGLRSGDADADNDGYVTAEEAYAYAYRRVKDLEAKQNPQFSVAGGEGPISIILARSAAGVRELPTPPAAGEAPGVATFRLAAELTGDSDPLVRARAAMQAAAPQGAASELATLRRISRALDDPHTLDTAAKDRPIADVVTLVAAVRAIGKDAHAVGLLKKAAVTRPPGDVADLAAAVRAAGRPSDADVLLAAAGGGRPAHETALVAQALLHAGGPDDITAMLTSAAQVRPPSEAVELAAMLRLSEPADLNAYADAMLRSVAVSRTPADVAEVLSLIATAARTGELSEMIDEFRQRPMSDAAQLVVALRDLDRDDAASLILGWAETLSFEDLAAMVAALRAVPGGEEDAEAVLRWAGWRRTPDVVHKLIGLLLKEGRTADSEAVVSATESRPVNELVDLVLALQKAGDSVAASDILALAATRSRSDVQALWLWLQPSAEQQRALRLSPSSTEARAHTRSTAALGVHLAARADAVELTTEFGRQGEAGLVLAIYAGAGHGQPTEEVLDLLTTATADVRKAIVAGVAGRSAQATADLLDRICPAGTEEYTPVGLEILAVTAKRTEQDLAGIVAVLDGKGREDLCYAVMNRTAFDRWTRGSRAAATMADASPSGRAWIDGVWDLQSKEARARSRQRIPKAALGLLGAAVIAVIAFSGGAALSRLLVKPHLDGGDWFAFIGTFIGLTIIVFIVGAVVAVAELFGGDADVSAGVAGATGLLSLALGFVLGFFVVAVAHWGIDARAWIAWNF
ncbi:caspase family protein [Hamadaea tsunoensis]|uniref:caspase family protein n=1 Tax=Hamadaea tsunoensis TaxID=53368 RepID=UPI00040ADC2B|nr:caspase family protein [Hamadaea tsunoensis]